MSALLIGLLIAHALLVGVLCYAVGQRMGRAQGRADGFKNGYDVGLSDGDRTGRAKGWNERHFQQIEHDRKRREANGRFSAKKWGGGR